MANRTSLHSSPLLLSLLLNIIHFHAAASAFDYGDALSKSILFLEAQRSGRLPPDQRVTWRGDSALLDGSLSNVDLVGGYYDAGDNIKFGFPMAFTITMLSWGALEYGKYMEMAGEMENVRKAIRWGTDYFLKAYTAPTQLWVQVGDPVADHNCWEHPEEMDTPRTTYQINSSFPGTEIAAETSAALASASIVLASHDPTYSWHLLDKAIMLFNFADQYHASYSGECPFYCSSSGYNDELLWSALWLFKATQNSSYLQYVKQNSAQKHTSTEFSWDNKYAGVQVLLSQLYFDGDESFFPLKLQADYYLCSNLPYNSMTQVPRTLGGLIYVREGANTQYSTGASFLAAVYADYLANSKIGTTTLACNSTVYYPQDILSFSKQQVDYILGNNPMNISYMVGFGDAYATQAHHRGASIASIHVETVRVSCLEGFTVWFSRDQKNPNTLTGAIVGGPDIHDRFVDKRSNSAQLEPTTYTNALMVGALARLYGHENSHCPDLHC